MSRARANFERVGCRPLLGGVWLVKSRTTNVTSFLLHGSLASLRLFLSLDRHHIHARGTFICVSHAEGWLTGSLPTRPCTPHNSLCKRSKGKWGRVFKSKVLDAFVSKKPPPSTPVCTDGPLPAPPRVPRMHERSPKSALFTTQHFKSPEVRA